MFLMLLLLVMGGLLAPTPRRLSFGECAEVIHAKHDTNFQPWVLLGWSSAQNTSKARLTADLRFPPCLHPSDGLHLAGHRLTVFWVKWACAAINRWVGHAHVAVVPYAPC